MTNYSSNRKIMKIQNKSWIISLSNYATKSEVRKATGVDIPEFTKKDEFAHWKSYVDKLETLPTDISKLM